ncbi:[citrate (pro-3S)-lyase] ligase [Fructobacillus ficulneus]|uniref:[Citrate [pro-3S]-lyase] ligase n=1 Tax=Fructobacillus ficulneus TaxID=157463 RepID=A0A0K8MJV4_9LACO|nr:[citrate (pro-3S)-lyase] ligase [Fructobacillus ficulneus]GAP00155.1 [citrate [pro-3S]-lyase] ligase [Fructobacillus ficulneus]
MTESIQDLSLTIGNNRNHWQDFLRDQGLTDFTDQEISAIDRTVVLVDDQGQWVGTGSVAGQTIKYLAVVNDGTQNAGARFNRLVSELENRLAQAGIFHLFVFTKPQYQSSFEHVGFTTLAKTDWGLILEKGTPDIEAFRRSLPVHAQPGQRVGALVMNANPFTRGHRYLVEQAAQENDLVYLFVVSQDVSLFTAAERLNLVRAGMADLTNVVVARGGDYMVSYLSFPAYFIPGNEETIRYQTALDAELFKQQIARPLGISRRYIGTEPQSPTTNLYNQTLKARLPPEVAVIEVDRVQVSGSNQVISASAVRALIKSGDLDGLADLVPESTGQFIKNHYQDLHERILKG